ncbi:MAG: dienelactone hydrolase family protein [Alphaproteobacteria bacterium]|nr:dienelactone hydrolase family protein [Alphaproteobacteria bacterium]
MSRLVLAIVTLLALIDSAAAELVRFRSAAMPPSELAQRLARERGTPATAADGPEITGQLYRPAGNGPFPALVILHGCDGPHPDRERAGAEQFVAQGYVVLLVDSFTTRGIKETCSRGFTGTADRVLDALGALAYLAQTDFVAPDRVAVLGFSQGAGTALSAVLSGGAADSIHAAQRFAAAVAYYPPCPRSALSLSAPALILIGELDDWTPAADCREMVSLSGGRSGIDLVVFAGAYHAFSAGRLRGKPESAWGHHLAYDEAAATGAKEKMLQFLARHLGQR